MEQKSSFKGFLKSLFEIEKTPSQAPSAPVSQPVPPPRAPKPKSEAYLNRKKGRTAHKDIVGHLPKMIEYLKSKEEGASSSEIAKALGLSKSTVVYNLIQLMDISNGAKLYMHMEDRRGPYVRNHLLAGKHVVQAGFGKYTRYHLVGNDNESDGDLNSGVGSGK